MTQLTELLSSVCSTYKISLTIETTESEVSFDQSLESPDLSTLLVQLGEKLPGYVISKDPKIDGLVHIIEKPLLTEVDYVLDQKYDLKTGKGLFSSFIAVANSNSKWKLWEVNNSSGGQYLSGTIDSVLGEVTLRQILSGVNVKAQYGVKWIALANTKEKKIQVIFTPPALEALDLSKTGGKSIAITPPINSDTMKLLSK